MLPVLRTRVDVELHCEYLLTYYYAEAYKLVGKCLFSKYEEIINFNIKLNYDKKACKFKNQC